MPVFFEAELVPIFLEAELVPVFLEAELVQVFLEAELVSVILEPNSMLKQTAQVGRSSWTRPANPDSVAIIVWVKKAWVNSVKLK